MTYSLEFSNDVRKVLKKWKRSNPSSFNKFYALLPELEAHPRTGTGHPEPLKGGNGVTYSRRLSAHDRIIYDIHDDVLVVLVIDVGGHYGDK
ncbi:MAG: type II toxin-antitoxin system YoeB family toxin [Prevotella sp.]|nr:type II toxin-antitoxin system YoeB family toxin [Prevotella sp.]